ncbi:MAG: TRAP transporter small permease subunit [Dehalococcoidales bacterium]
MIFRKIVSGIEWLSEWSGRIAGFFILGMIFAVCYEVFMRYLFNSPTLWYSDVNYMLGGSLMAIGQALVFKRGGHVRIDVVSTRFSENTKVNIDIFFTVFVFIPVFIMLNKVYWGDVAYAIKISQTLMRSTWYPPSWPFKAALATGFALFLIQGVANLIKDVTQLATRGKQI